MIAAVAIAKAATAYLFLSIGIFKRSNRKEKSYNKSMCNHNSFYDFSDTALSFKNRISYGLYAALMWFRSGSPHVFCKKDLLNISQISQNSTCAGSVFNKAPVF